jgi:hypothetical protein
MIQNSFLKSTIRIIMVAKINFLRNVANEMKQGEKQVALKDFEIPFNQISKSKAD